MLKDILQDDKFVNLNVKNITECINFLFEKGCEFGVVANLNFVEFSPNLPKEISKNFKDFIILELANYTLSTAKIQNGSLVFEAGFGEENFVSNVKIPLFAIMQILIDFKPICANFSLPSDENLKREKSKNIFKR